jgi:arabinogalactan oligomer / maltooligosaccharide transport system substrate-binding protein
VALPGDQIARFVEAGLLSPLDDRVDATWLAETYLPTALDALRLGGSLWGLPLGVQTVTFIYNANLIGDEELSAQTSEILSRAREYQVAHDGIWYLVYPARDDVYFAAPWFYGAGAWYAREDGSVGLDTPAGAAAAAFLSSLREVMPADIDYTRADALFKSGQAAIIVNGSWYLPELEAAGISYGLQIMPVVSSSGQPARPLVSVDGLMLGSTSRYAETAAQVMAYLTNAESELQWARQHDVTPANRLAIQRAGDEGLGLIVHFAKQAELGQALPASPTWGATWAPVQTLLEELWAGEPAQAALEAAQREAEAYVATLAGR